MGSQFSAPLGDRRATFSASAIANPANAPKVEVAFKDELARALRDGFAADEVAKARNGWLQSRRVQRAEDSSLVAALPLQAEHGRTMAFAAELERKVNALTPEQISAALRKHIEVDQISFFKAGDFRAAAAAK